MLHIQTAGSPLLRLFRWGGAVVKVEHRLGMVEFILIIVLDLLVLVDVDHISVV